MRIIKLELDLMYDDEMMHSSDKDPEAKHWFIHEILRQNKGRLLLWSNEIGDEVGRVIITRVKE